jgi:hypothetical protein
VIHRRTSRAALLFFFASLSAGAAGQDIEEPPSARAFAEPIPATSDGDRLFPEFKRDDFHGYVWTRLRFRTTGSDTDLDILESALLDIGDPERSRFTASLLGDAMLDIGGQPARSPFFSIQDTFDSPLNGRLLHAYVDLNRTGPFSRVRGGRQESPVLPEIPVIDGLSARTEPFTSWNVRLDAFGGVPSHLYESNPSGDWIAALGVETEPARGSFAAFHAGRVRDSLVDADRLDTFTVLEASQQVLRDFLFSTRVTSLSEGFRDLDLRGSYANSDSGWRGQLSWFALLRTQKQLVTEFDPFFPLLREENAYSELRALLSKDLGERFTLEGSFASRQLHDDGNEGPFNHEFWRLSLTPTIHDWPVADTDVSVTGELWEGEDRAVRTVAFDVSHDFSKQLRASAGTEYALFEFSPFFGEEREDVETVYLRGFYALTAALRADASVDWETDSLDDYVTVRLGLRWRF